MITRQTISAPGHFQQYVDKAGADDLSTALSRNTRRFKKLLKEIPRKKYDYAYGPDKWTLRQLLQHLIDAERVFVLRALWFARQESAAQPGFDENKWAENAQVAKRKWKDMTSEFFALRSATEYFFNSLDEASLLIPGLSGTNSINAAALGFVCAGHVEHHMALIEERYLAPVLKEKKATVKS